MVVSSIKLNTGRSIPGVGFGTGTSFINRGDDVTLVVQQAYQVEEAAAGPGVESGICPGGAQHPFGHDNSLKSIDFIGPGGGDLAHP